MSEDIDPVTDPRGGDLTTERLAAALSGSRFGQPARSLPVAVTSESLALAWARQEGAPEGALVVVDQELTARVRRGIPWVSHAGRSLAFSLIVRPDLPPEGEGLLWLLTSLAASEGVEDLAGHAVALKWPNDVLIGEQRLGGIRVDAHLGPGIVEFAVLTVRLNVGGAAEDLPTGAVTLGAVTDTVPDRDAVLAAVVRRLDERYDAPVEALLDAYRQRCSTLGRRVRAELSPRGEVQGVAVDVSASGGLVLETPTGRGVVGVDQLARLHVP